MPPLKVARNFVEVFVSYGHITHFLKPFGIKQIIVVLSFKF